MTPHKDTHPKVVEMMRYYYEVFDHIKGRQICEKVGIRTTDLNLGPVCLNHILGKCTAPGCTRYRVHAKREQCGARAGGGPMQQAQKRCRQDDARGTQPRE